MALYTFIVYPMSDFSVVDFTDGGSLVTNATLNPITIVVEELSIGSGSTHIESLDSTSVFPLTQTDPDAQTIFSSTDPSITPGDVIFMDVAVGGGMSFEHTIVATSDSTNVFQVNIGGTVYMIATKLDHSQNIYLQPNHTYNDENIFPGIISISYNAVICFAAGTQILTAAGEVPVEDLQAGDRVITADHGLRKIGWVGSRKLDAVDLAQQPHLRPIRIKAGALGEHIPKRDLTVSPQHRMLISSHIARKLFGAEDVLIPAIKLLQLDGIEVVEDATEVEYFHILMNSGHEIILANGAPSESLYTGKQALKTLSTEARAEIEALFPMMFEPEYNPKPARKLVQKTAPIAQLLHRHTRSETPLVR